ncbi:hypothetical protein C8Q74DRAFT_1296759 [Fomes fomentarius]|nr:hypothetical protein C8Q74DRAFT_1296759 [Fomes fomentarius]
MTRNHAYYPKPELSGNPFMELEIAQGLGMLEAEIYATMAAAINAKKLVPGLTMALAENAPDPLTVDDVGQKIDAALFLNTLAPNAGDGRPHWADQLIPIEFKRDPALQDPFDDRKDESEPEALERKKVWGQIIDYSELILSVQHRVHLLMLLVMGRKCRLLRWDRSGVIVSSAFDYYERWEFFCDILWRISVLAQHDPTRLGEDPSAHRLSPEDAEWAIMDQAGEPLEEDVDHRVRPLESEELPSEEPFTFKYVHAMFKESLQEAWPRYRLEVPDGDAVRDFYVCRPYFRAKGVTGRGTRGYVALEIEGGKHRFRWLKDAWRVDYEDNSLEGDILKELNSADIRFVPTLVCHGDIHDQKTKTQLFWEMFKNTSHPHPDSASSASASISPTPQPPGPSSSGSKRKRTDQDIDGTASTTDDKEICPLRRHAHYRVVVAEVCMPLSVFTNGRQLVSIIVNCMSAHHKASQLNILHRDVSGGNILVYPIVETRVDASGTQTMVLTWVGILTDWELSKRLDAPLGARQPVRTGTWQYMSVAILTDIFKIVEITDDLESFLYVLLYYAIRYLRSNCDDVGDWIEAFFDSYTLSRDGSYTCGEKKAMTLNKLTFGEPMDELFDSLFQSFKAYYAVKLYDSIAQALPSAPSRGPSSAPMASGLAPSLDFTPITVDYQLKKKTKVTRRHNHHYAPSELDREQAENVSDHDGMLALLIDLTNRTGWPLDDKVGDRVPKDSSWTSEFPFGAIAENELY